MYLHANLLINLYLLLLFKGKKENFFFTSKSIFLVVNVIHEKHDKLYDKSVWGGGGELEVGKMCNPHPRQNTPVEIL